VKKSTLSRIVGLAEEAWKNGENVTNEIRKNFSKFIESSDLSPDELPLAIEISYDLQSGTYTRAAQKHRGYINCLSELVSRKIQTLAPEATSILDAGTGEATTFSSILMSLDIREIWGVDASFSRLTWAQLACGELPTQPKLACADIRNLPFQDKAFSVAMTVHALEPNGGREGPLLAELERVTRDLLVLVEPDYKLGSEVQRERMRSLGYISDLRTHFPHANLELVEEVRLGFDVNPDNSATLFILRPIKVSEPADQNLEVSLRSPLTFEPLRIDKSSIKSDFGNFIFPIVDGIHLLREEDAILASSPSWKSS
jgi:hypothetical protein